MALRKRGGIWYFRKMINGRLFRESTGFADRKAAERRANEIELDIRAGVHGWKSTIPSFAEWWDVYRKTYTPLKSARNRDAQIVNSIHDEIVVECAEPIAEEVKQIVVQKMIEGAKEFLPRVPVGVEAAVSDAWLKK